MEIQQVIFLLILGAGLVLFVTERFRVDVTAMLILAALTLTGILSAEEAVAGFYRFGDFLRVGVPLTVLLGLSSAWLAQWLWLGGPLVPDVQLPVIPGL